MQTPRKYGEVMYLFQSREINIQKTHAALEARRKKCGGFRGHFVAKMKHLDRSALLAGRRFPRPNS
jgi:hypothetical protein